MKRGILAAVTLLLFIAAGQAQENARTERLKKGKEDMDQFFKEFGVNDEQMAQIDAEQKAMVESMKELRGQGRSDETKEKMLALRDDHAVKMKSILTDEQYQKWEKKAKEKHQHQKHQFSRPN